MTANVATAPLTATLLACVDAEAGKATRKGSFDDEVSTACSQGRAEGLLCWTKQRVLALCGELLQGYCSPDFQLELKKLSANSANHVQVAGRMELALKVQREVLPKYGFSGTLAGVEAMREAICPFLVDWMIKKLVDDIDKILGLPPNSTENAVKGPRSGLFITPSATERVANSPSNSRDVTPGPSATSSEEDGASFQMTPRSGNASSDGKLRTRARRQDVSHTKAQILELLGELLEGYSPADFQQELQCLPKGDLQRKELVLKVQSQVLPKYNLPGSAFGVMLMFDAITPFVDDFLVNYLLSEMDDKLGLPKDTTANMCKGTLAESKPCRSANSPKASRFSRKTALNLCNELLQGFKAPEFQAALQALTGSNSSKQGVPDRAALALSVQSKVLPKYGLPGTTAGVLMMLDEMAPLAGDWLVATMVNSIDEALGLPAHTTLTSLSSR